jgi:FecR protein
MTKPRNNSPEEHGMNDPYLWDGSGQPDPELQRLESLLTQFRHRDVPPALPPELPAKRAYLHGLLLRFPWIPRLAAAAVVVLALIAAGIFSFRPTTPVSPSGPGWEVARLDGTPQIGTQFMTAGQAAAKLRVGQTLETNSSSRASISDAYLGEIKVDPNSRVRLLQTDDHRKRIQLDVGTIHAMIWAPPGEFVVDTPSAIAVDLGCAYTLQVAADGTGTIRTTLGWVGFHLNGRESFIPAGAMCPTRPKVGPGTPYFEDASEAFRVALADFDFATPSAETGASSLEAVLSQARAKDGLTLWHLLSRTDGLDRAHVYARFAALVPPPPGVTRDGILRLDQSMLDLWWNSLNLGDIYLWRYWEQSSSPRPYPSNQPVLKEQLLKKQLLLKKSSDAPPYK